MTTTGHTSATLTARDAFTALRRLASLNSIPWGSASGAVTLAEKVTAERIREEQRQGFREDVAYADAEEPGIYSAEAATLQSLASARGFTLTKHPGDRYRIDFDPATITEPA